MASSLKSKFVVPALLAGAALLTGCNESPHDKFSGMKEAIKTACPTENKDYSQCASIGTLHAQKLAKDSGITCKFEDVSGKVPDFAVPMIAGSQASECLEEVEHKAGDPVVKEAAHKVRTAMTLGLAQ